MNSVPERDVVRQLVQLAVDRQLTRIRTGVGNERKAVVGRDHRIRNDKISVEEEFQDGDASAGDRAVTGRIGRVRRRAFGEGLREEVIAVFGETGLDGLRIEDVAVEVDIDRVAEAAQDLADDPSAGFRAMPKVDPPLLIPDAIKRKTGGGREGRRECRVRRRCQSHSASLSPRMDCPDSRGLPWSRARGRR